MLIGPARLCSMVSEHDDVLNPTTDQLTIDIFSAPSIQVSIHSREWIFDVVIFKFQITIVVIHICD